MVRMDIGSDHCIELENLVAERLCLLQAVLHEKLTQVEPPAAALHCIAGIGNMADAADIVRMKNVACSPHALILLGLTVYKTVFTVTIFHSFPK